METDFMHDLFSSGGVRVAVVGVLSILALFLLAQTVTTAEDFGRPSNPATDTVTVTGDGQATVAPDVATVSFTVQNTADSVATAQAATTQQANTAISAVEGQGVAAKDVQTTSYDISPQYASAPPCGPDLLCPAVDTSKVTGYQVAETIQVTEPDLSSVGSLLQSLGNLGVQNVSGPDFTLSDPSEGIDAARADAITKARAQAALLATQLGVSLGKIVNFSDSNNGIMPPYPVFNAMAATASGASAAPSVPIGQNTYTDSVSITYEIR